MWYRDPLALGGGVSNIAVPGGLRKVDNVQGLGKMWADEGSSREEFRAHGPLRGGGVLLEREIRRYG